ncbi:hypothetical protein RB594_000690 [Gaeumannomyces avenae]
MVAQAPPPNAASKLSAYLSRLNPVPGFPEYTGPHKVGTIDVEIPVSELPSPCPVSEAAAGIPTVLIRVYYPATPDARGKRITWLPAPQRQHLSGYGQFLGIGPTVSSLVSFLPRHLYHTSIPVLENAPLLDPPADAHAGRWPTMVFSHGLGGSRNAYSHLAGSLASHGVVVFCPEHRDGSAVSTMIPSPAGSTPRSVEVAYRPIAHTTEPATWEARDGQLRIRTWELGLALEVVFALDDGSAKSLTNLKSGTPAHSLPQFAGKLHIQDPGSIIWGGHSFGAATIVQLLKSTYYADRPEAKTKKSIFEPSADCRLRGQVTERSVVVLLDMWCFPLVSPDQSALFRLPLPCYADTAAAPGGAALLAVESDAFFKWTEHLHTKALALSPVPTAREVSAAAFERPATGRRLPEPHFFRVRESAHLNQSDFGILFPWLTRRVFSAREPERVLRLNVRAVLQALRANGFRVARTCAADLVDGDGKGDGDGGGDKLAATADLDDDPAILDRSVAQAGAIDAWSWVDVVGLGPKSSLAERRAAGGDDADADTGSATDVENDGREVDMQGEIEPHLAQKPVVAGVAAAR